MWRNNAFATVVANKDINPGVDFLPLTVDYREKFYDGGKIPGNFFRRETKPSDDEVLTMRFVDRVLRVRFSRRFPCRSSSNDFPHFLRQSNV